MLARIYQSVLAPAGPQSATIDRLWWLMFWVATGVFVTVIAAIAAAVIVGRRRRLRGINAVETPAASLSRSVSVGVGLTVVILFVLLIASFWTERKIEALGAPSAVTIEVVGHQWWWEFDYEAAKPSGRVVTANVMHIPTGRPIAVKVTSRDVIHSFWVPNLTGKRDLIPGYETAVWLQADRAGRFRGQCAEFCGRQHAHMAFDVVAESDADFERWLDAERADARPPQTEEEKRGLEVFQSQRCAVCHQIRGTLASAQVGPELTHFGSRPSIGAGTLPNTVGHLAGWIADPQSIKPGNQMPTNPLSADDLQALTTYLRSLQ